MIDWSTKFEKKKNKSEKAKKRQIIRCIKGVREIERERNKISRVM